MVAVARAAMEVVVMLKAAARKDVFGWRPTCTLNWRYMPAARASRNKNEERAPSARRTVIESAKRARGIIV